MRKIAFALLLLLSVSHASIQDIVGNYTKPGERVETSGISTDFGTYTLITINGADSMLVDNSGFVLVEDTVVIYAALKSRYLSENQISVDIGELIGYMEEFNASKGSEQALCEQYTGTDRFECKDFSTCRYACLSVPLCRSVFEGQGDGFIYSVQNWRARDFEINDLLVDFDDAVLRIPETPEMANLAWDYLGDIKDKAEQIQGNKLFLCDAGGYCFCYNINFSLGKIDLAKQGLTQITEVLSQLPALQRKADIMASITEQRIRDKLANDEVYQYQKTYAEVKNNFSGTKEHADAALALVDSGLLSENITALRSVMNQMGALGEEKNYSGAVSLQGSYFGLAKQASGYADKLINDYMELNKSRNALWETIDGEVNITSLGGYFSEQFALIKNDFGAVEKSMKPPVKEESIPVIETNITALGTRMKELQAKAGEALKLISEIDALQVQLVELSADAERYRQDYGLEEVGKELQTAHSSAMNGELAAGRNAMQNASDSIAKAGARLAEIIPVIEEAKGAALEASTYLEERSGASFMFFSADLTMAEKLCSDSTDLRFSSPRDSIHYAQECKNSVDGELQGLEYKKYGLFAVVIIALGVFFMWARKREWSFVIG